MKRENLLKIYKIDEEIKNLKNYNDRKFLKDGERDKLMTMINELKKQKDEIFFRDKIQKLMQK